MTDRFISMRVARRRQLARAIMGLTLEPAVVGMSMPPAPAGAHVAIRLPPGVAAGNELRHYSLTNAPDRVGCYEVAILREAGGRGGSIWLHEALAEGDILDVSAPRALFGLAPDAGHVVLIAGGIGIAPIWALARAAMARNLSWELHYAARSNAEAAFLSDIRDSAGDRARIYLSGEGGARLSLGALAGGIVAQSHVYCCGPARMMADFERAFASWPSSRRHRECFVPVAEGAPRGACDVTLARSGRVLHVGAGQTILEVVRAAGMSIPFSCGEGVCGMCETRVLEGDIDHRCSILTESERACGKTMMICCSRARGGTLTLDL